MHPRSDTNYDRHQRKDLVSFLRKWFDPQPQIAEMRQVVFWKDMFVEAVSLGYILIAVILLLNTCNEVSEINFVIPSQVLATNYCVCMCMGVRVTALSGIYYSGPSC